MDMIIFTVNFAVVIICVGCRVRNNLVTAFFALEASSVIPKTLMTISFGHINPFITKRASINGFDFFRFLVRPALQGIR